jgi:LysM repeat protein
MQWKRILYFLFLNILISAATTLVVLTLWDRSHRREVPEQENMVADIVFPTVTPPELPSEPAISLQSYQVSPGETLGEIALRFDVEVEELLTLNGLMDPHSIGAGETIFIPVPEVVTVDAAAEDNILKGNDPSATNTGRVEIVAIFGAGDLASERLQLRGLGEGSLSLTGWLLRDEDGNEYTFPKITLFGNGAVDVYSTAGVDTVVALYWGSGEAIWEPGERATLIDRDDEIQATYTLP